MSWAGERDMLVVIVCGGRHYQDKSFVFETLSKLRAEAYQLVIVEGGCPTGADAFARDWVKLQTEPGRYHRIQHFTVHPAWGRDGRLAAGPIRNRRMLENYEPDLVLAFEGGRGTKSCIDIARELGVPVRKVRRQ